MSLRIFLLLSFVFVFATAQAASLSPNQVRSLLEQIRSKRAAAPQVRAEFEEEKTVHLMNKPIASTGKVWFASPNKFRREVEGNSPSVTVSDGEQLWIYYPKFKSAEHYSLGKHSPLDAGIAALTAALNLENIENSYHISGNQTDQGYELHLVPRNPSLKRLLKTFTINLNRGLQVQRTQMDQPNGDRIVTVYRNESRAAISLDTFEFTPPPGTNVTTPLGH